MIDIHCHILHGIDDGPRTLGEGISLAKSAVKEGIHTIIATPHHKNGRYINTKQDILKKVTELNDILQSEKIPLTILPGQETAIHGEILRGIEVGEILTLDRTQYLFIEFPASHVPHYSEQIFYELQLKGIIPIIVHPERNAEIIERPDILYQLVKNGALVQITASSIVGRFGKKIKAFSEQLIDANLVHFIASDAHNTDKRSFYMQHAYSNVRKRYGTDMVYLFRDNAELLTQGKNIYKDIPARVRNRKMIGWFN
ncbi:MULTISPECIES: CpsB/CapC family capsule biosynthesis tyrosine phosphatase [unclassified Mesobacillus]|uniref:tyrosine-protein phosphatase n=1 Tax=unclassified Mesobacillus TaxID=2675270 RepID=UPI00203D5287|nr:MULTISPECIES: CpsB/CapC family capsule biosynthesis tyrosine phosphatase [unclassified Mesobacillus]MCM3124185.1 tyrosine protein phosphatase [Mesobacillus sp. MER 33]MCM3234034.1 tyrosine protein phosphatase [Mesobacillus sp. MER 48]